LLYNVGLSS